ncbi:MAG: glycoside hydrolase family 3 C-terminal domain-containing protein [Clostridia bacterium]|nr:glycoside hydrolase family 3 C-terminal domain-containing protein [Clostridia bacterium]
MLANERLIIKMSLGQKVRLITSPDLYKSSPAGNYEFPVFTLSPRPSDNSGGFFATQFPCDKTVANSWNMPLISKVYRSAGAETRSADGYAAFKVTDGVKSENFTDDYFYHGKFSAAKINGLKSCGQYAAFESFPAEEELMQSSKLVKDVILADSAPDFAVFRSAEDCADCTKQYKYKNLLFGIAENCEQAAAFIFNGCSLVYLTEDFTEGLISYLTELTINCRAAYADYKAGKISLCEFDRRCRSLEILDEALIDAACDKIISLLLQMKERAEAASKAEGGAFDKAAHVQTALSAARQSAVLLKNQNVLPLSPLVKIAVIGGYAKEESYQAQFFNYRPAKIQTAFEEINNYDISAVGYAEGYAESQSGRADLTASACELCSAAEAALVYLCADKNATALPAGQTELLNALSDKGVKIIAVVAADNCLDFSFADKCAAVLFTGRGGEEATRAALDLICGKANPSGRLALSSPRYPFGFGLSYTQFEYRNLKINEHGASCTVVNTGERDGYAVVQLYVKKDGSQSMFKEKVLRGFAKVYVKRGDAVRAEFPFDVNAFKVYDTKKKLYRIEGGDYSVYAGENIDDERLTGVITLSPYVFKDAPATQTECANGETEFSPLQEPEEVSKAKKQLSFGLKLALALILAIYYNAMLAVFAFTDIVPYKDLLFYAVIGGLAVVADVLIIAYIAVNAKKRRNQNYLAVNEVLTDMVSNVAEFDEIAKTTYIEPVKEAEEPEKQEISVAEAEAVKKDYDLSLAEEEEFTAPAEKLSMEELCSLFRAYCRINGVAAEQSTVRAVVAAFASNKIIVLSSKNTELLPAFAAAVNGYFGSFPITEANESWASEADLLWRQQEDKFVVSDFANAVYSASKSPDKLCAAVIGGVNFGAIGGWFGGFTDFANHPTEEKLLTLGEELSFPVSANIRFVLAAPEIADKLPREIVNACMFIDAVISAAQISEEKEDIEIKPVSYPLFEETVTSSRERNFISEKIWKKLDSLAEAVNAEERFSYGNKNIRQLEKFTSVILECGGDESEALSSALLCKIVPLLKATKLYKKEGGAKTLFGFIEKLFPDGELTKIQKALSEQGGNRVE